MHPRLYQCNRFLAAASSARPAFADTYRRVLPRGPAGMICGALISRLERRLAVGSIPERAIPIVSDNSCLAKTPRSICPRWPLALLGVPRPNEMYTILMYTI